MVIYDSKGNRKRLATAILHFTLTVLTIISIIAMNKCNANRIDKNEVEDLYTTAKDSLIRTKNKLGEEVVKTSVLTTSNIKLFTEIQFKDKDIQRLQQIVKNAEKRNIDLSSALFIANQTLLHYQDSIRNLIDGWESDNDSSKTLYPIYKRDFKIDSCFVSGNVRLGLNTFDINLQLTNEFEVTIGDEKINWFKRKQFAEVTSKNKCTTIKTLKVYDKKEKKTNIMLPFGIGVGTGILILLLLL